MLPVVSSAVFLSVGPSLVTIRFGSSEQLLSRGFRFAMMALMAEKAAAGRGRRKEKKLESTRSDQTAGMAERASTPLSVCLSDPPGRDEAVAQEGAQNSVKEGAHFGTYQYRVSMHESHEALTLAHPTREVRVFKAS